MPELADLGIDPEFDECGREDPPAIELWVKTDEASTESEGCSVPKIELWEALIVEEARELLEASSVVSREECILEPEAGILSREDTGLWTLEPRPLEPEIYLVVIVGTILSLLWPLDKTLSVKSLLESGANTVSDCGLEVGLLKIREMVLSEPVISYDVVGRVIWMEVLWMTMSGRVGLLLASEVVMGSLGERETDPHSLLEHKLEEMLLEPGLESVLKLAVSIDRAELEVETGTEMEFNKLWEAEPEVSELEATESANVDVAERVDVGSSELNENDSEADLDVMNSVDRDSLELNVMVEDSSGLEVK